jgi:hypothetical protein
MAMAILRGIDPGGGAEQRKKDITGKSMRRPQSARVHLTDRGTRL